ncbi:Rib/alpha-like domain-containing protein [Arcanobacterium buesumense]|uniref:Long Rib domain-containing protein n=1 Tax=Arcanobacterium buesumense TaxID=2722751 RepID=A0A6H2EMF1_9ACTO|nr:Rib/alpha-like domain-containing protein [Arcanobacterium buesumense]QJC22249.1 hypothetical protein HC352_06825 [Arcanobacterium buesumense]
MTIKRTHRVSVFLTATALVLMGFGSGLFTPLFAHADTEQNTGITVNFDFTTLEGKTNFADHVWVYQWSNPSGTPNTAHKIDPAQKSVTFEPLNNEPTAHFIVFIGDYDNTGIKVWDLWNERGSQAQTADITAKPGQSYLVKYDQLRKSTTPQPAKMSELYTPLFTGGEIERGKTLTLDSPRFTDIYNAPATPSTKKYAVQGNEKLQATINDAGVLLVTPKYDAPLGKSKLQVTVTYTDGSTDTMPVNIDVKEAPIMDLTYTPQSITVHQGETATLNPKLVGDNALVPAGTVYAFKTLPHASLSINPNTGVITVAPENDAQTGTYELHVNATNQGVLIAQGDATVTIVAKETPNSPSTAWDFSYEDLTVTQKEAQNVNVAATLFGKDSSLPHSITFDKGNDMHEWVTVDSQTGTVTAKPDEFVAAQTYTFHVTVNHLDGTTTSVPVTITVTKAPDIDLDTTAWDFSYEDLTVTQKEAQSVNVAATLFGKDSSLPHSITFDKGNDMHEWVTVDSQTGTVTAKPDEFVAAQTYTFHVTVNHLDGTTTSVPVTITVTKAENSPELDSHLWKLSYADVEVQQLKSSTTALTSTLFDKERALPHGVTFAEGENMPSWITVDAKTGSVTAKPSEFVELKDYVTYVVVTHLDGKTENVDIKITVTQADPETTYPLTPLKPGKHTIPALELTPAQPQAEKPQAEKPQAPKPVETPSTGLAKTGLDLAAFTGLALISMLAGAAMARRRNA